MFLQIIGQATSAIRKFTVGSAEDLVVGSDVVDSFRLRYVPPWLDPD
jgi:hypothetical protein